MVNDLYTSIATRLEELFDSPDVYFDKLPQDFLAPAFFVKLLKATHELKLHSRYELVLNFDVHYFPTDELDCTEEINDVAYKLLFGLEYIKFNGFPLRGTEISYEVQEGILHFFITYRLYIKTELATSPYMQKLYQKYGLKEVK